MVLELYFEFGKGQYINFTEASIASRASILRQARETTKPHAPGEPPNGCLGDPAAFLLECISELIDVLWFMRPSPDMSPEDVSQIVNWRRIQKFAGLRRVLILQNCR